MPTRTHPAKKNHAEQDLRQIGRIQKGELSELKFIAQLAEQENKVGP